MEDEDVCICGHHIDGHGESKLGWCSVNGCDCLEFNSAVDSDDERKTDMILCDGCNVNKPWEHRCHGRHSVVMGEHTHKQCECPDCNEGDEQQ